MLRPLSSSLLLLRRPILALILLWAVRPFAQGDVYLVLGSDTSIWDGLDVNKYICHYKPETYSAPSSNAYKVINESYRANLRDSFGRTMPLTWWMHSGNVFRHADNNDVPLANTIAMHLMKRHHGSTIARLGDELTLHYHTWDWTDENGDGRFYWNQAHSFAQCREDFDITLCHYLLEEEVFPVSFRSGWHYMDNLWQAYLDELLPFCLHNAYPGKHIDLEEPTDNDYDWSQSSAEWVPFHPSLQNYQLAGSAKSWNVRCLYMGSVSQSAMDKMFSNAAAGKDQLACLWSHLPETDFPDQITRAHAIIVEASRRYPGVRFHYMTAIAAMQAWLKTTDHQPPALTFVDRGSAEQPIFSILTDEPIFQKQPFVAIKDIYGRYQILPCTPLGANAWEAVSPLTRGQLATAGVALTDTVGNQALQLLRYLPEDLFLDNESAGYREVVGRFATISSYAWGTDARSATVGAGDSAVVRYELPVAEKHLYHLSCQFAPVANPADSLSAVLTQSGRIVWRKELTPAFAANQWRRIETGELDPSGQPALYLVAHNRGAIALNFSPDGIKISPLITDRQLEINPELLHFGETSLFSQVEKTLQLGNAGREPLTVSSISTRLNIFQISEKGPVILPPYSTIKIAIRFYAEQATTICDTLEIISDDPIHSRHAIPLMINASAYYATVDNADAAGYSEFGAWHTSVTQAFGPNSRFAYLAGNQGAWAQFEARLMRSGFYEICVLHPKTVNSSNHALYKIRSQGKTLDSLYLDQNAGSGTWIVLGRYELLAGIPAQVQVIHSGGQSAGDVLRADAVRFTLISETTGLAVSENIQLPGEPQLLPNYPNPFNPATAIRFFLPTAAQVNLDIYDLQGRRVRSLWTGRAAAGEQEKIWDGRDESGGIVASGLYFSVLFGEDFFLSRRMFLVR